MRGNLVGEITFYLNFLAPDIAWMVRPPIMSDKLIRVYVKGLEQDFPIDPKTLKDEGSQAILKKIAKEARKALQ